MLPRTFLVAFALLPLSPVRAADAPLLRVTLKARAALPAGAPLRLGEVAQIEGSGADRARRIALGDVPGPGRSRSLSAAHIARALELAGFVAGSFALEGARQPRIQGLGQPLDGERVRAAVNAAIKDMLPGAQVKILALQLPNKLQIEPGVYELRVNASRRPLRSGANRIPVEIVSSSGRRRRIGVTARLEINGPVLVAAREIPRGERIRPRDLRLENRAYPTGAPVLHDAAGVVGRIARSTLRTGQPLRASALARSLAVQSGQLVQALFRRGGVSLTLETRARGEGEVGSIVPVVGVDGRTLVRSRVVAPGEVVVLGSEEDEPVVKTEDRR